MAYIYCADKYCDACGKDIIKKLKKEGFTKPESPYDSDEWPKSCLDDEESDGPEHCGSGPDCLDPWEDKDGTKYGHFFENNLTGYGVQNIKEMHLNSPSEVTQMWVDYYEGCGVDFNFPPTEPQDDDWVTNDYKLWIQFNSNHSTSTDPEQWAEQLRNVMEREEYWPNCWYQGERGEWNLLTLEGEGGFA